MLLQNATAILIKNATVLLQDATTLLKNATVITKTVYYKLQQYNERRGRRKLG